MELVDALKRNTDVLYGLLGAGVFVASVAGKDVAYAQQAGNWAQHDLETKVKIVLQSVIGRMTGINPFDAPAHYDQTINPSGMINGFSIGGTALWAIGSVFDGWDHAETLQKVGTVVAIAGAIGGLFDPVYQPLPSMPGKGPQEKLNDLVEQGLKLQGTV